MSQEKVAVVTGANGGLGYQVSLALARQGATVVMACRNPAKAEIARREILEQQPDANMLTIALDVSEPDSIERFAGEFSRRFGVLDLLVNNAGIVGMPLSRNSRGQEMHLATNYLGAFVLTGRLMPFFRDEGLPRIVNVGSLAHRFGELGLHDFNWENQSYNHWRAYARSKLALLAFTIELDRRLRARKSGIVALAAHPGFAATEILDKSNTTPESGLRKWFNDRMRRFIPPADDASRAILYAAVSGQVTGGEYYGPGGFMEIAGEPAGARVARRATGTATNGQLWAVSERMSGVQYLSD